MPIIARYRPTAERTHQQVQFGHHAYGRIPVDALHVPRRGTAFMSEERIDQEHPCLHCMMVELIDDFFAEYPAAGWRLRQSRYN